MNKPLELEGRAIVLAPEITESGSAQILYNHDFPRRFGLASHIGLLNDIPTIGCAKTRLIGDYEAPQRAKGSFSYLTDGRETIGAVVRTRTGVKPLFVSIGHLMDLKDSIRVVLKSCRGYRLPEPIRRADHLSKKHEI